MHKYGIIGLYTGLENSDTKFQFNRYDCMIKTYAKNIIHRQTKSPGCLGRFEGRKTINQISTQYQIHPTQIHKWKTIAADGLPGLFSQNDIKAKALAEKEKLIEELYKIIGQRETELSWLKKKFNIFNL